MSNQNEIKALFKLLDDPDEVVYENVYDRILSFGTEIIPSLEEYWLQEENEVVQQRIESLIQRVSIRDIKKQFATWEGQSSSSLFEAMSLLCRYQNPYSKENKLEKTLKSIHRSCWLELNNYLTPLEEVNIINSIVYSMYKFSADRNALQNPDTYYLCDLLNNRKGNQYSLAMLYLMITQMLDIPVFAMKVSNFVILGYVNTMYDFNKSAESQEMTTQFFIEPTEGTILSKQDVDSFIKKYDVKVDDNSFKPLNNKQFAYHFAHALGQSYKSNGEVERANDILSLLDDILPDAP